MSRNSPQDCFLRDEIHPADDFNLLDAENEGDKIMLNSDQIFEELRVLIAENPEVALDLAIAIAKIVAAFFGIPL